MKVEVKKKSGVRVVGVWVTWRERGRYVVDLGRAWRTVRSEMRLGGEGVSRGLLGGGSSRSGSSKGAAFSLEGFVSLGIRKEDGCGTCCDWWWYALWL